MSASTVRKARAESRSTEPWVSVREASRLLRIAPPTVLTRVIRGELEAQSVGGLVFISRESITRALAGGGA